MGINRQDKNKAKAMVRDFWPKFHRRTMIIVVISQVLVMALIGFLLIYIRPESATDPYFWIVIFLITVCLMIINIYTMSQIIKPTKYLAAAITQVAGEPTSTTPPNPNDKHFSNNGLGILLQTIYELDYKKTIPINDNHEDKIKCINNAVNEAPIGFIVLNKNKEVIYANKISPVHTDNNNNLVIDLIFESDDTLDAWLDDCKKNAVHAQRTWLRIANKLPESEDRHIYDIAASYQKASESEVIITLIERTAIYQPEDDDLDFISFAAHELRGPITVIHGYLDVLTEELMPVLKGDQEQLLNRLTVSANRLSGYVNNILNASRYDRRHLKINLREYNIQDIYNNIRDDMELRASSQGKMLSFDVANNLPTVAADSNSIGEVLSNLIDNALKYSNPGGQVSINAEVKYNMIEISVSDTGIGMPGNVVNNLFHKFYRSHRSRETVAGTGIGLYITKAMVESHGGKISVHSVENEGSTFTFSLPIYSSVAEKLKLNNNSNESMIDSSGSWINNHSMYRG